MKINMPVTNTEVIFDDSVFMLTKTDLKGIITYANQDFIKTSGYSEAELVGQSHNIVRHPDMPVEAFENMWHSLKVGKPWTGMVKNRTKQGDFYWVEASAAPIFDNGQITGYLSARRKPTRQQVEAAANAYRLFKDGQAKGLIISNGEVVQNTIMYRLKNKLLNVKIKQRMMLIVALIVLIAISLLSLGLHELSLVNKQFKNVYENRMLPAENLGEVAKLIVENRTQLRNVLSDVTVKVSDGNVLFVMNPASATKVTSEVEHNIEKINQLWKAYMATEMTSEEKRLADKFIESRKIFVNEALMPAIDAIRENNYQEAKKMADKVRDLYINVNSDINALITLQSNVAKITYQDSMLHYEKLRLFAIFLVALMAAMFTCFGILILRSITGPLKNMDDVLKDLSSGKNDSLVELDGENELGAILNSLKITQTRLAVNENAAKELADAVKEQSAQFEGQLAAISNSTGVIEFNMDGTIVAVNDMFLKALGCSRTEVVGQHHSVFVDASYRLSPDYKAFWGKLNRGEAIVGEFQRVGKSGKDVWLQASYNPILCAAGKPYKVVKYATDITEQKNKNADYEGQINAINKSQGVIEIGLDGVVLKVNGIYLKMLGYTEQELLGKHVSMVLDPAFAKSSDYAALWDRLVKGGSDAGQYKRIAKGGKEVWIQASYNPIFDLNGKVCKIANYTIDITEQKLQAADNAGQIAAINIIQGVIEFDLTGKVTAVNDVFGHVTSYSEKEILGNHHSMFVEPSFRSSHSYKAFWERLASGEAVAGQYKWIAKGGREIWLQASYNPIMDLNGKPFKVVTYTTDITEQHKNADALAAAVEETQSIIEAAKDGDLSSRVSLEGKVGAIASLCDGVNALMDQMTEVIVQVRESGETINTAAGEIASGNNDLSSRTEQQASSLEETAASMEELASTVKNNAENAKQANQLAIAASGIAVKGGKVVSEVVSTMSAINSSAKKIEDIISVIDGIAFQTNILALNAAVEAARAGEQGRGFAVVAGEVRNLAQRSASAAKEIKELITDSVSKTAEGTKQVETAGSTMQEIVSSVQRVTDIMGEITAASVEQSAGIDQVNTAVTSMDEVTQQNAALVEQAAAAAESLVEQAVSLIETVSAFRLSGQNSALQNTRQLRTLAPYAQLGSNSQKSLVEGRRRLAKKTNANDEGWEEF